MSKSKKVVAVVKVVASKKAAPVVKKVAPTKAPVAPVVVKKGKKEVAPVVTKMVDPRTKKLGRPPIFTKGQRRTVSAYLRKHGLTHGLDLVFKERKIKMSAPTAIKVAQEYKITFTRGRPVLAK